jgi:hypothetical protein
LFSDFDQKPIMVNRSLPRMAAAGAKYSPIERESGVFEVQTPQMGGFPPDSLKF